VTSFLFQLKWSNFQRTVGSVILISIDVQLLQQQKSWTISINRLFVSH